MSCRETSSLFLIVVYFFIDGTHGLSRRHLSAAESNNTEHTSDKMGLVCKWCTARHFKEFNSSASWFYTYNTTIQDESLVSWANDNDVEFVPMISHDSIELSGGTCTLHKLLETEKLPRCHLSDVIEDLQSLMSTLTVQPRFLLGFNEAYVTSDENKSLSGTEAANLWRKYVQPAAVALGLQLVSPTLGQDKKKLRWTRDFFRACDDWSSDPDYPCHLHLISAFSVHDYMCAGSYWTDEFGGPHGGFQQRLKKSLNNYGARNWKRYIDEMPIWVTEHNCNWDDGDDSGTAGLVTPDEQCLRATGQSTGTSGRGYKFDDGSIRTMEGLKSITRYSWWNVYNPEWIERSRTAVTRLVNDDGDLFPPGLALVNRGAKDTGCLSKTDTAPWQDDISQVDSLLSHETLFTFADSVTTTMDNMDNIYFEGQRGGGEWIRKKRQQSAPSV